MSVAAGRAAGRALRGSPRAATRWGDWSCPVCGGGTALLRWEAPDWAGESGARAARPSSEAYGDPGGRVVTCAACGHGSLADPGDPDLLATAYGLVSDPVSLAEEPGQVATADRLLAVAERFTAPGSVLDVGAWTGSLLVAATERGWRAEGVEPSRWAVGRARDRSLTVHLGGLEALGSAADSVAADAATRGYALVTCCDVLEHFYDPGAALGAVRSLLAPGGLVAIVGPDAGSRTARMLGRRWWSVLPMHPQYFTRASMGILLRRAGFEVCALGTHPKAFSARYYAERLGGYAPTLGRLAGRAVAAAGLAERLVAPDFGDRMLVIARLAGSSTADAGHDNGSGTA